MAEQLNLTAAEVPPSNTAYRVERIIIDTGIDQTNFSGPRSADFASIHIQLRGNNGEAKSKVITGVRALNLVRALNKANLGALSLERRILQLFIDDADLAGTLGGVPD